MNSCHKLLFRLRTLFRREKLDADMAEEMRLHLERRTARYVETGMSPEDARHAALRNFGGVEQLKERARDERGWVWFEQGRQDIRHGLRSLRKAPTFTAVAILSLALGIGANTAIFSFVNGVLLKPLAYADADRIVTVFETGVNGGRTNASMLTFLDWEGQQTVFERMAAFAQHPVTIGGEAPQHVGGARVSADFLEIFGVNVALGRTFTPQDNDAGSDPVAILSQSLWKSRFGADPSVVGRTISLDGELHVVIGVLSESPVTRRWGSVWRPLRVAPENRTRNYHWLQVVAKLKAGVALPQARAQMETIASQIGRDFPDSNKGWGVGINRFADDIVPDRLRQTLHLLLAAVGLVFLIACVNIANLTLVRGLARSREIAVRASLGAGRGRLIRQFFTESMLLALAGMAIGIPGGYAILDGLKKSIAPYLSPPEVAVTMDGTVLLFALGLALVTGVVCGVLPALQSSRVDLAEAMKQGGGTQSVGGSSLRLSSALVVIEIALSVILLSGAGLLVRSLLNLGAIEIGTDPARLITAQVPINDKWRTDPAKFNAHLREIIDVLRTIPGVQGVALASGLPTFPTYGVGFQVADRTMADVASRPGCFLKTITPDYFSVVGVRLLKGRALNDRDGMSAPRVAVINEIMAQKHFRDEDPIGKRILIKEILLEKEGLAGDVAWEVVGVVANERTYSLSNVLYEGIYVPSEQSPQIHQALVIRTSIDPASVQPAMVKAVQRIDPDQQLLAVTTLARIKTDWLQDHRIYSTALGIFATAALLLAAIGIYGVVAYSVVRRTRELGIRAALGATRRHLLALVLRSGLTMVAGGLILGGAGLFALTRLMTSLLYGVGERDPITLALAAGMLAGVALAASYFPARRAMRVDPLIALRCE